MNVTGEDEVSPPHLVRTRTHGHSKEKAQKGRRVSSACVLIFIARAAIVVVCKKGKLDTTKIKPSLAVPYTI
jgi:hypothetical protein